jgi:uncharacterized heparinase superfamily protein
MTDTLRIAAVLARRGTAGLRRTALWPRRTVSRLVSRAPDRLLIAPPDIRTSDPTVAADIGVGYFAFGGRIVNARDRSPFTTESGSDRWLRQMAGFGWLRHLRAADNALVRARGRQLVESFLAVPARQASPIAWEAAVTARRVLSWLSQSPLVLDGADRAFYARFMGALDRHRRELEQQLSAAARGRDRLIVALALAEYGLCVEGSAALQKRGTDALAAELDAQVLPDGGHVSRDPQILIDLLIDLLPLRQAYAARGLQAPAQLLNAMDRMVPMLRLFRHGDGTLALFNGMGQTAPELVATILAYDDARARPLLNARQAGYQRLEAGDAVAIVDTGPAPPRAFSGDAHAGCLSFEFSVGPRRLVVNCGTLEGGRSSTREAARTTAAHSTLVVDDTSSCRFATGTGLERWLGDEVMAGPLAVKADRGRHGAATVLVASHDGYAAPFGLVHHRTLQLDDDGGRLGGRDTLENTGGGRAAAQVATLRFHLHPSLRARIDSDGYSARLVTPDGDAWLFEASAELFLEPSILFASPGGPRPTTQIKITGPAAAFDVRWSLQRIAALPRPQPKGPAAADVAGGDAGV